MNRSEPREGHHKLAVEVNAVMDRFGAQGIPKMEQIAVVSQVIGQRILDLDAKIYPDVQEVLHAVLANIAAGNQQAQGPILL